MGKKREKTEICIATGIQDISLVPNTKILKSLKMLSKN